MYVYVCMSSSVLYVCMFVFMEVYPSIYYLPVDVFMHA